MTEIPTRGLQLKIAQLLHDDIDVCDHLIETGPGLDNCPRRDKYILKAGFFAAKLMPTISREMFPVVRRQTQGKCPAGADVCQPMYWCPTVGEYESPCHGGFVVCCDRPDLHRVLNV